MSLQPRFVPWLSPSCYHTALLLSVTLQRVRGTYARCRMAVWCRVAATVPPMGSCTRRWA